MSIESHIIHHLTAEGVEKFTAWAETTHNILLQISGFESFRYEIYPSEAHVWVRFDNDENRQVWTSSEAHREIVGQLDPYRSKPYEVNRYELPSMGIKL